MKPKTFHRRIDRPRSDRSCHVARPARLRGYVLLETVIATGLLVIGLAVIGAQVQGAHTAIRKMERRTRAMMLADVQLAEMSMGLIELDTLDEEQEDEFGTRYPDWGWRLTLDDTEVETLYLLKLEVLYQPRENVEEIFDYDEAEVVHTLYMFQAAPQKLNLAEAFGIPDDQMEELAEKLAATGIEGLDPEAFDPAVLASGLEDFEEFIEVLPLLLDAFGIDISSLAGSLPPELLEAIRETGLLDGAEGEQGSGDEEEEP